jgi:HD-like signal output (HDOD) protein
MTARALAKEVKFLFSLPEVAIKLTQLLDSPWATNGEIGEVILNDPALTAQVLKLANGSGPKAASRVEQVSEAVALIGRKALRDLVLATSVTGTFQGIPPEWMDMDRFWFNSVVCGVIARSLAFRSRIFQNEPLFVAGLLHKVGRLVFLSCRPEQYRRCLEVNDQGEEAINRAEEWVFGYTHAELGAELLRSWGLPERLQSAVAHYLAPNHATRYRRSAAYVHVASALASIIEPGISLNEMLNNERVGFDLGAWNLVGLPLDAIPTILDEALIQAFEIFDIIRPLPMWPE